MARPPAIPPSAKARLVLKVLSAEITVAAAGRAAGVSGQAVSNWRRAFITAGTQALENKDRSEADDRERQLILQISELRAALREAYALLRSERSAVPRHRLPFSAPGQPH